MNGILIDTYNALWYLGHVWIDLFELIDCHKFWCDCLGGELTKIAYDIVHKLFSEVLKNRL
jgi:hypothetical protein